MHLDFSAHGETNELSFNLRVENDVGKYAYPIGMCEEEVNRV
jgi:hypothetical protein